MAELRLAYIDVIQSVSKHPNADSLYIARVQGWDVIINLASMFGVDATEESVVGQKIVYIQIDSIMPVAFKSQSIWKYLSETYMGMKVKSTKIRGMYSQGAILDFATLKKVFPELELESLPVDTNITNMLGIVKYYSTDDLENPATTGSAIKPFPEFLEKTDQIRLQAQMRIIKNIEHDRLFTATQKYDGQSVQWFVNNGVVGVCSRNYELNIYSDSNSNKNFRAMNHKYDLLNKLKAYGRNISVQTEMYGTNINANRHKLNRVDIAVFNVFDIDNKKYLTHAEAWRIAGELGLPTVAVVFENKPLISHNIDQWLELANQQKYSHDPEILAEGIVVCNSDNGPYVSFKVISQEYLVKHKL